MTNAARTEGGQGSWEFKVELHAFGERGQAVRYVDVPSAEVQQAFEAGGTDGVLGAIFHYGQNDFQPKPVRSVSVGDILGFYGPAFGVNTVFARYVVKGIGFEQVPEGWAPPVYQAGVDLKGRPLWAVGGEWKWGLPGCEALRITVEAAVKEGR